MCKVGNDVILEIRLYHTRSNNNQIYSHFYVDQETERPAL